MKLTAHFESFGDSEYYMWVDNEKFSGTFVQGSSLKEAWKKLLTALKVKLAYDYNMKLDGIEELEMSEEEFNRMREQRDGKKDINLILQ